jgi:hypothetical protein
MTDPIFCLNLPRGSGVLHPTLIVDEAHVLLVDTGLPDTWICWSRN